MQATKTVSEIECLRKDVLHLFPDAIRGSVAKTHWDKRRKVLHLTYWFHADTAGGTKVLAKGPLFYFIKWDTNFGDMPLFADSDYDMFARRLLGMKGGQITRTVCG